MRVVGPGLPRVSAEIPVYVEGGLGQRVYATPSGGGRGCSRPKGASKRFGDCGLRVLVLGGFGSLAPFRGKEPMQGSVGPKYPHVYECSILCPKSLFYSFFRPFLNLTYLSRVPYRGFHRSSNKRVGRHLQAKTLNFQSRLNRFRA